MHVSSSSLKDVKNKNVHNSEVNYFKYKYLVYLPCILITIPQMRGCIFVTMFEVILDYSSHFEIGEIFGRNE